MATPHEQLNEILKEAGVSKTVYALVMPETEAVIDRILGDAGTELRAQFHDAYREAWTQKQDAMHEEFFATWKKWNSPIVQADWNTFPYMYPTSGAGEGLREAINNYAVTSMSAGKKPRIHVFEGEYEGFGAYAKSAHVETVVHNRKQWRETLRDIGPGEQFYLSQPSAIDGNVWEDYDEFAQTLLQSQPTAQLMLDLTYVGCVAKPFKVKADYPNIPAIFFSLSKPAGAYYHRIGGMLARDEYPGLFGNKWFKNLMSLRIGTELMKNHDVYELPRKYRATQAAAITQTNEKLGLALRPSDVFLLATQKPGSKADDLERYLTRGSAGEALVRVCLTPTMAHMINAQVDPTVRARPHEGLQKPEGPQ